MSAKFAVINGINEDSGDIKEEHQEDVDVETSEASDTNTNTASWQPSKKLTSLTEKVSDTKRELEQLQSIESRLESEDLIVQEKRWLEERTRAQRKLEDTQREELYQKQKLLEEKRKGQAESLVQNRQMQLYNQMHEQEQADQIYGLNGITLDKVEGMVEYRNALYQGISLSMFLVAISLCAATYFIYGLESVMFFAMLAITGAQTSILLHEKDNQLQHGLYGLVCKVLGILATPVMAVLFILKQTNALEMQYVYIVVVAFCGILYLVGSADFFLRNPYRGTGRAARKARAEIKELKHSAAKTVKKNQKVRQKLENKLIKQQERQEKRLETIRQREEEKAERLKKKLDIEKAKKAKYEELSEIRRKNREQKAEIREQKIVDFKARLKDFTAGMPKFKKKSKDAENNEVAVSEANTNMEAESKKEDE